MYILLLLVHVIVCFVLIFVVLLQAGRGGGFSDMMGGGQPQSLFGTQTNAFMVKATEVCAVVFIITSLSLAILSTQRGKSLVANQRLMKDIKTELPNIPKVPEAPPQAPSTAAVPATATPVTAASTPAPVNTPAANAQ